MKHVAKGGTTTKGAKSVASAVPTTLTGSAPDTPAILFQKFDKAQVGTLRKPTAQQVSDAPAAVAELTTTQTYQDDFGKKALPAGPMVDDFKTASMWSVEADRAQRWADYTRQNAELAWDKALGNVEIFKKDHAFATHHDVTIPVRYPALTSLVSARSTAAQRGAETKKAKKAAAKKASAAQAPANDATPVGNATKAAGK